MATPWLANISAGKIILSSFKNQYFYIDQVFTVYDGLSEVSSLQCNATAENSFQQKCSKSPPYSYVIGDQKHWGK